MTAIECRRCHGTGSVKGYLHNDNRMVPCPMCRGTGRTEKCPDCGGTGETSGAFTAPRIRQVLACSNCRGLGEVPVPRSRLWDVFADEAAGRPAPVLDQGGLGSSTGSASTAGLVRFAEAMDGLSAAVNAVSDAFTALAAMYATSTATDPAVEHTPGDEPCG